MIPVAQSLEEALSRIDRAALAEEVKLAEEERAEVLRRFPRERWPDLTLEEYAIGHPYAEDAFCRWMEFRTLHLGSLRGSNTRKLIIFKRRDGAGWHYPKMFSDEQSAWEHLRADFVRAFSLADDGEWEQVDSLEVLSWGTALKLKTLHVYFPNEILPVTSTEHLRRYLRLLKRPEPPQGGSPVALNRALLTALREEHPELEDWTTHELMRLLYRWSDPRGASRVYKISPGEQARFWDECRQGGYICVAWDDVGDLREFESKEEFRERFSEVYGDLYNGRQGKISEKANELWTLRDLQPGDLIVANQGLSQILAVGEVIEPGYVYREDRLEHRHTVAVEWDTSYARTIHPQRRWGLVTVARIPEQQLESILGGPAPRAEGELPSATAVPVDPFYLRLANTLERKGQLILYGPPGTGKTYTAGRFAVWWLLHQSEDPRASMVLGDAEKLAKAERDLSTSRAHRQTWWLVANRKEWSWDQLFESGEVEYRRGRLVRNYARVKAGDLVVGYQSTPDKRIVALGTIARGFESIANEEPTLAVRALARVTSGPTYEELLVDPVLSRSEPMRFRNQGTLFALSPDESDHLTSLLIERSPELAPVLEGDHDESEGVGQLTRVTFHPSYAYEDFIEGFRPLDTGRGTLSLRLEDGIFKRVCRAAQAHPQQRYLVLIDEINRGNVAKVLGELLTVLERDKRGVNVTLPQSKEAFAVPPNVYVLGTMNTADRSIKLMDAALRRRFAFLELMPDIGLLRGGQVGDLALDEFLEKLNRRIAEHEGREKQIGHSYLLDAGEPVSDVETFAGRFCEEILPLLQEYCYDEYATLARFIGTELVHDSLGQLDDQVLSDPEQLVSALAREFGEEGPEPE